MESSTTEGAPVAEGLPEETNGIGDSGKKKRQRQKHAQHWQQFMRARSIPGKIWMPTNQIRTITARAHASRELRARAL